jgi:hypothetical protein
MKLLIDFYSYQLKYVREIDHQSPFIADSKNYKQIIAVEYAVIVKFYFSLTAFSDEISIKVKSSVKFRFLPFVSIIF